MDRGTYAQTDVHVHGNTHTCTYINSMHATDCMHADVHTCTYRHTQMCPVYCGHISNGTVFAP